MSDRAARRAAWTVFVLSVALWLATLFLQWEARAVSTFSGGGSGTTNFIGAVAAALVLLVFSVTGLLIATRRPDNVIGRLLLATGIGWALLAFAMSYADYGLRLHPGSLVRADAAAGISLAIWVVPIGLIAAFLMLLFPDGHLPGRRWRWVAYIGTFTVVACFLTDILKPGTMEAQGYPNARNPFGIEALRPVVEHSEFIVILIPVCMLASAVSLVVRFRRADIAGRQQIKWLAAAAAIAGTLYLGDLAISAAVGSTPSMEPGWLTVIDSIMILGICLIPAAIGVAVLRYRLYEIDTIIRRTLGYALLVATLAAVYLCGVVVIGTALRSLTGSSGTVAVTLSTLAVAVVFQPLRGGIQRTVDRRFYRPAYDAQAAVDAFSDRLREQLDLDALCGELRSVVSGTVHPAHASLWLRSEPDLRARTEIRPR
jgi:hypothetical protein